jgi:hypothetical protein
MRSDFDPAFPVNFFLFVGAAVKRTFRARCRTVPRKGEFVADPEARDSLFIVQDVIYLPEKLAEGAWGMVPQVQLREPTDEEVAAVAPAVQ